MQSLLVKLASIAVMVHMTLGCNWHHGLGVQACVGPCATTKCDLNNRAEFVECCDGYHEHGEHEIRVLPELSNTIDELCDSGRHKHFGCEDDGCNAIKLVKFIFWPAANSSPWPCGAENSALVASWNKAVGDFDPFPDYSHTATPVRVHLLLGVQLL